MTTTGTATAGPIMEPRLFFFESGGEVEAGSAMMLEWEATMVLEPPPDFVMTDVTTTMEVWEETALLLLAEVAVDAEGEREVVWMVEGKEMEVAEAEFVKTWAAESEKPVLLIVKKEALEELGEALEELGTALDVDVEVDAEGDADAEAEWDAEVDAEVTLPPEEETTWRLLSWNRLLEVLQHPRLESPPASGRLASQQ